MLRRPVESAQFTSVRYGERLAEIGAAPSIGTVGDFDNALAETVNGLYKTKLVYGPARGGPWKTVEDLELATLGWGALAQHQPPARLPRGPAPRRVRSRVLRCPPERPSPGRNPIARVSITSRAVQPVGRTRRRVLHRRLLPLTGAAWRHAHEPSPLKKPVRDTRAVVTTSPASRRLSGRDG